MMSAIVFRDAAILDGTGARPWRGDVRVEGTRIAAVRQTAQRPSTEDALAVECGGRTLMPGLIESHAHLSFVDQTTLQLHALLPVEEHLLATLKHARLYLDSGYTSCFSAAAAKPRLDIVTRNAIDRGDHPGPRTLAASVQFTPTGAAVTCASSTSIPATRCTRIRATVRSSSARPRGRPAAKAWTC